jgi:acetyltransferase-like isoleucine patch superfamily enzyme
MTTEPPSVWSVAALADELEADPSLLRAWASEFTGEDPVTLLIFNGAMADDAVVDSVRGAMRAASVPDLAGAARLAIAGVEPGSDAGEALLSRAVLLFSRSPGKGPLARLPRVDDRSIEVARARIEQLRHPQEDGAFGCFHPVDVAIGRQSYTGRSPAPAFLSYRFGGRVKIGSFCSISNDVRFHVGGEHLLDRMTTSGLVELGMAGPPGHNPLMPPIVVGHDVWIGHSASIMAGVTIGIGAVVGACAVVAKDVRPYAVVVGNPAREIRRRFPDDECELLLSPRWWELDDDQIRAVMGELFSTDVRTFVARVESVRAAP